MTNELESDQDFSQIIVNNVAALGIASQIKSSEQIDVNLEGNGSELLQGKIDSLQITGEKIIAIKDLHLEQIDLSGQNLSLNLTQAILGKIAFEQPGNFQLKLIFTESDCDRLLNSEYVRILLQNLCLELDQGSANFYLQQSQCHFSSDGSLSLNATVVLNREQETKIAQFEIELQFLLDGLGVKFIGGKYLEDQALDLDETVSILNKVRDLLYLRHFADEDLTLDLTKIAIKNQQLVIQAHTLIKQLPESISQSIESVSQEVNDL